MFVFTLTNSVTFKKILNFGKKNKSCGVKTLQLPEDNHTRISPT